MTDAQDFHSAYLDLEQSIREVGHMAELARCYVCATNFPANITEEERTKLDRACFAICHVADMAKALHVTWQTTLQGA